MGNTQERDPAPESEATITLEIAKHLLTRGGRRTTPQEVDRFMEEYKAGTPIMPIKFVCDALDKWADLYGEPFPEELREGENDDRAALAEKAQFVFLQIRKSNLLDRLLYQGQEVRKHPCPQHKGRWSGCKPPEEMECRGACADGINVTGWLRE